MGSDKTASKPDHTQLEDLQTPTGSCRADKFLKDESLSHGKGMLSTTLGYIIIILYQKTNFFKYLCTLIRVSLASTVKGKLHRHGSSFAILVSLISTFASVLDLQ